MKLIIANWKLNPITTSEAKALLLKYKKKSPYTVVVCPPSVFLTQIKWPNLGAQNCFWQQKGAFTGQISPLQLKNIGVSYCLVGHSETRMAGETSLQINLKIKALLEVKITPVICIGYNTQVTQDELEVVDVLKIQLQEALAGVKPQKVIVAYEPVWAISNGNPYSTRKVANPEHAEKISLFIKTKFKVASVLYGGSVNSVNAQDFLAERNIDGLLVGGASLIPDDFNKIITNIL